MAAKKSPEEIRAEQEAAEYATWVAVRDIPYGDVIAFREGHAVPVSHVERYGYDEQGFVKRVRGEERQQAEAAHTDTTAPLQ